jgi:hypothetical protein
MTDINSLLRVRTMAVLFCASMATTTAVLVAVIPFATA